MLASWRMTSRERLILDPIAADPEVGRWLAALEEVRRDTLQVVAGIPEEAVDRDPGDGGDSVGTTLYHVVLIEIDWVFTDVLDREADVDRDLFPFEDRVADGRLMPVTGESLGHHLDRLAKARARVLDELGGMTAAEFHRPRSRERYDVSAAWVVFHLIDHEVEHRVRLSALRDLS
jgi:uncharacterized damage-inducible protein DinB